MITKKDLKQIESIKKEIIYFKNKLEKIDEKPIKIVQDSVLSSDKEFPYIKHTSKIVGFENPKNRNKYKKMIKNAQYKLEKMINQLEYELEKIEDSELRMIIRYRYEDGLDNNQTAHKMNENGKKDYTADGVRMRIKRFFEKK